MDLLISLTYCAASDGGLEDFPDGMHIEVPPPWDPQGAAVNFDTMPPHEVGSLRVPSHTNINVNAIICSSWQKQQVVAQFLHSLPSVLEMKQHLERKRQGELRPTLQSMDPKISNAAWSVLRWCIASCTSHIEELTDEEDRLGNIGQFHTVSL